MNPIELRDQYIVNLLVVFCRAYKKYVKDISKTSLAG